MADQEESNTENSLGSSSNREEFQHIIRAHVKKDSRGKEYLKFSTYLSFLQLTFRVYLPDLGKDTATVLVQFGLKRSDRNREDREREKQRTLQDGEKVRVL